LVIYLETLVAFCQYYRADDHHAQERTENFYHNALGRYEEFTDKEREGKEPTASDEAQLGNFAAVEGVAGVTKGYTMSEAEEKEEELAMP
jgi:hypothetical protein